jgi:tetratricopeptide (TPR) repeat protein
VRARRQRGHIYARQGHWQNAAADLKQVTELTPNDAVAWYDYACVLVLDGNDTGYEQLCRRVIKRFGQTKEGVEKYLLARILTQAPNNVAEPELVVKLAEDAVRQCMDAGWNSWGLAHSLALVYYRAGRFDQAVAQCQVSLKVTTNGPAHVVNWLLLAMAHQRLGHGKEAREGLDKASRWIDQHDQGNADPAIDVSDWLAMLLLRREAEGLIKSADQKRTKDEIKGGR